MSKLQTKFQLVARIEKALSISTTKLWMADRATLERLAEVAEEYSAADIQAGGLCNA